MNASSPADRDDTAPKQSSADAPDSERRPRIARIQTAPPNGGELRLGLTLPDLLVEAVAEIPNPTAFNQLMPDGSWRATGNATMLKQAEELGAGLRDLGLAKGDRVALFMHSDSDFCWADLGCLIAGTPSVPLYLAYTDELIGFALDHSEASALVVSDAALLARIAPLLESAEAVRFAILVNGDPEADEEARAAAAALPERVKLLTAEAVRERGERALGGDDPKAREALRAESGPDDLATILYTSGTTGTPKGVMLSHQNISSNVTATCTCMADIMNGADEVALSFLPLTHIFARMLQYCYMRSGSSVYFCDPKEVGVRMREVRPTIFVAVPHVIEKVFNKILAKGAELKGPKKYLFHWALELARQNELGQEPSGWHGAQLQLANRLIFNKWRDAMGGRARFIICGGAPLRAELANIFHAAGVTILQGYGLTETSPILTANRADYNRAGTVGMPMAGVEVAVADDGEILARGPNIMLGYYKNEEATREAISPDGWFHTGDLGELTDEGFLRVTDRKKNMFKLATGKYVTPQPLEGALMDCPLIETPVVIGHGKKYCSAMLFMSRDALGAFASQHQLDASDAEALLREPLVLEAVRDAIRRANRTVPAWSSIKRFMLLCGELSVENKMLTPTMKLRRSKVAEKYGDHKEAIYADPPVESGAWIITDVDEDRASSRLQFEDELA